MIESASPALRGRILNLLGECPYGWTALGVSESIGCRHIEAVEELQKLSDDGLVTREANPGGGRIYRHNPLADSTAIPQTEALNSSPNDGGPNG